MESCYEVFLGNRPAGKVEAKRQGLYIRIICRCHVPGNAVYRLYAETENRQENLGVVVPEGDGFILDKKIPAKRLDGSQLRFLLSGNGVIKPRGDFIPISPEEPFFYLDRLKNAFLQCENGKIGIRIEEHPEAG